MINTICICGAGTMGSGIAQLCAQHGFTTILFDVNEKVLENAKVSINLSLQNLISKHKISPEEKENIFGRINFTCQISGCIADIIIEAIVENIDSKVALLQGLAAINNGNTIFASNTSSLSISLIQEKIFNPEHFAGMHFFNPAPVMKLVEVVKGQHTSNTTMEKIFRLCEQLKKTPVLCKDAPGFIVNRVARPYYLEAMKLTTEGIASIEEIDAVMEATGFKIGPFKLMDLIGMDINLSVSQSIYEAMKKPERLKPSTMQIEKVKKGDLGKKSGRGFYIYPSPAKPS